MKLHRLATGLAIATLACAAGAQSSGPIINNPGNDIQGPDSTGQTMTPPTGTMPAERWSGQAAPQQGVLSGSDPAPTAATAPPAYAPSYGSGTTGAMNSGSTMNNGPMTREQERVDVHRSLRNGAIPNSGAEYSRRMQESPNGFQPQTQR